MKRLLTYALLIFAVAGIGVAVIRQIRPSQEVSTMGGGNAERVKVPSQATDTLPIDGVVVTYFTSDVRCASCFKIESLARQTVERDFGDELRAGRVVFRAINVDQPASKPFVDEYQLVSKTVVVSSRQEGEETKWTNLQDVWLKLGDEADFRRYVGGEIRKQLDRVP